MTNRSYGQVIVDELLFEMPKRTGRSDDVYPDLLMALSANRGAGFNSSTFGTHDDEFIMKIDDNQIYVWREVNGSPQIIVQLKKYKTGYAVDYVGKLSGSTVDASEFYSDLLKTFKTLIFSGDIISDQGAGIWKKLMANHFVSVYDTNTATSVKLTDPSDIDNPAYDNEHTRFVISESIKNRQVILNYFEMLRIMSLSHRLTPIQILEHTSNLRTKNDNH
jgi:hypothetical protein